MWLMTQHGFYSIVQKRDGCFHIRARVRKDLENVLELMGWNYDIERWPRADYKYRILVEHSQVLQLLQQMALRVEYDNFKNRIHELPDQNEKSPVYGRIWSELLRLQR